MGLTMRCCLAHLCIVMLVLMISLPVSAMRSDIRVYYDNNRNLGVDHAKIEIWDVSSLIDTDYTDADGLYTAYLDEGISYHFYASKFELRGDVYKNPESVIKIYIR